MSINERIKQLRKEKGLNQKQFATMLGITQSGASYMEQPGNNVSDSSIKSICNIFSINEEWLRNGIKPMYIETNTFNLNEFVKQHGGSDLELQIMKTYFDFEPEVREALLKEFIKFHLLASSNSQKTEHTVAQLEEEYKKTVLHSALRTESAVSNTIDGIGKGNKAVGGE